MNYLSKIPHKTIGQAVIAAILLVLDHYEIYKAPLGVYQALVIGSIITFKMRIDEFLKKVDRIPQVGSNKSLKSRPK